MISVSRINEHGYEARLRKYNPHLMSIHTGEVIPLRREKGMYLLDMWIWIPGENPEEGFTGQP